MHITRIIITFAASLLSVKSSLQTTSAHYTASSFDCHQDTNLIDTIAVKIFLVSVKILPQFPVRALSRRKIGHKWRTGVFLKATLMAEQPHNQQESGDNNP